jgi:hypothetical protein
VLPSEIIPHQPVHSTHRANRNSCHQILIKIIQQVVGKIQNINEHPKPGADANQGEGQRMEEDTRTGVTSNSHQRQTQALHREPNNKQ